MSSETTARAVVPMEAKPRGKKSSMPSIVSEGLHIAGNLFTDGDVQVDGRVEGDVQGHIVTVGATGTVLGKIIADEAMVGGTVHGEVRARSVLLMRTAKVACDVIQEELAIEAGAAVEGSFRRPSTVAAKAATTSGTDPLVLKQRA